MALEYWHRVIESGATVPTDRPLTDLTADLVEMLGSPDPARRDDIGYELLARWVEAGVYDDFLASLGDAVIRGLVVDLGVPSGDSVFRRSFSALALASCVERDNESRLLTVDVVMRWAEAALSWFARERDERGWVESQGWAHTIAHGADLIGAFAASPHLTAPHLGVLLDVITERVGSTASAFQAGEEDRLSLTVLTILQRNLLLVEVVEAWLGTLGRLSEQTRATALGNAGPTLAAHNATLLLRALFTHLSIGISPEVAGVSFSGPPSTRADVLLAIVAELPRASRWLYPSVTSSP